MLTFVTKQATLMRRSTVLSLSLQLVFPADHFLIEDIKWSLGIFNDDEDKRTILIKS
jgi:hypothetical protein